MKYQHDHDASTPNAIFKWKGSTDKTRPHDLSRPDDVKLRIAQITDMHIPGEIELVYRLRDLMAPHASVGNVTHILSAVSNEFNHRYRSARHLYSNILKKALCGLHFCDVDHLIVTGDVAHCGLPPEFMEMRAVLQTAGWWGDEKLTVVPGNHDRFNLYEKYPSEPMEKFFDVVGSHEPRSKKLPGGVALIEFDSNVDRNDDRHFAEQWLPNSVGRMYPEEIEWVEKQQGDLAGMRVITVLHHHISDDWYGMDPEQIGGFMRPVDNGDQLLEMARLLDDQSLVLHGHKHQKMPVDYTYGAHPVSCPGGFADTLLLTFVDVNTNDEITLTHAQVRATPRAFV